MGKQLMVLLSAVSPRLSEKKLGKLWFTNK